MISRYILVYLLLVLICSTAFSQEDDYDVVVYGATPAGISAAVNTARQGVTVGLFEASDHLGGIVSSGMSNTDFKTFEAVWGTYREFMNRVVAHYEQAYGEDSPQVRDCYWGAWYEPKVALKIFQEMLAEHTNISVHLKHRLTEAEVDSSDNYRQLEAVRLRDIANNQSVVVRAKVFIDATYEGDLMAAAGCPYRVGRESREEYGELFAGVKYYRDKQFLFKSSGAGDHKIQCYNFRICMTNVPENRVPIDQPPGYQREEYLPLLEWVRSGNVRSVGEGIVRFREIPNGKADVNDLMYSPFSLRLVGENYDWPEGSPEVRQRIFDRHKTYSLGLFYFLQNDAEIPAALREEAQQWGLPKDEFEQYGHFPPALYVREGRRLHGDYVLTEYHTQPDSGSVRAPICPDAIAICDYSLDSHGNGPEIPYHPGVTEGVFNHYVVPYPISYRVMLPPDTDGLLVPVAVSASHVGFSSLRMEPTWVALGQAAGLAAAQSVVRQKEVRHVDVSQLQQKLYEARAITFYTSDVFPDSPYFAAVQYWGTQGLFHHLPEYEDVPYIGRGAKGDLPGQWIEAYPYHAISPDRPMTDSLAQVWLEFAGIEEKPRELSNPTNLTRGEFLALLYEYRRKK